MMLLPEDIALTINLKYRRVLPEGGGAYRQNNLTSFLTRPVLYTKGVLRGYRSREKDAYTT
jgi:hypothetical protein